MITEEGDLAGQADYDASRPWAGTCTAIGQLLCGLRRGTTIETGLFEIQADHLDGLSCHERLSHPDVRNG